VTLVCYCLVTATVSTIECSGLVRMYCYLAVMSRFGRQEVWHYVLSKRERHGCYM